MAKRIRLALDRMPNTIHTGFYVALAKGWYEDADLEVAILSPEEDAYRTSATQKVATGEAELALATSESLLSLQTQPDLVPMVAVASVLAKDASAIITLHQSGIDHPAALDGKTYASHEMPFEDHFVRQMVINDGGVGDFEIIYPEFPGIWNTLLSGAADAAWIFLPWEGVEARLKGLELNAFQLAEYGIPYGYNPVLLAPDRLVQKKSKKLRKFLKATARGYQFAKNDPFAAAQILLENAPELNTTDPAFVEQSQVFISQYYLDEHSRWGLMQIKVWEAFIGWLLASGVLNEQSDVLVEEVDVFQLFTNDFLPS